MMALRKGNQLQLVVSMASVDQFIGSEEEYFDKKRKILEDVEKVLEDEKRFHYTNIQLNVLD